MKLNSKTFGLALCCYVLMFSQTAFCRVRLPLLVSDGIVLQRDAGVQIWGWADADEKITLSFNDKTYNAIAYSDGKWARFVEIGTGKPMYYDRGRIRVNSTDELHIERRTGYGYESNLAERLQQAKERFASIQHKTKASEPELNREQKAQKLIPEVKSIMAAQDKQGRWVSKNDRYKRHKPDTRWNGEYDVKDRISSAVFNQNINTLCEYLELVTEE